MKTGWAARKGAARPDWQGIVVRENHGINPMNDAVGLHQVGNRDARGIALVVHDHDVIAVFLRRQAGKIAAIAGKVAYEAFPFRSPRRVVAVKARWTDARVAPEYEHRYVVRICHWATAISSSHHDYQRAGNF